MKYAWIKTIRDSFPVATMCPVLGVSTRGFYGSLERRPGPRAANYCNPGRCA